MENSKSKILLVVEGQKVEPRILGSESHGLLSLLGADYEIVSFANPIYELYEAYKNGEYDDLVSYLRLEKGLKIDSNVLSKNAFSAVYLVFDFDPQYQKYSDDDIKNLLELFNNETELGKLYINYPMVESFYHLESLPDPNYNNRSISLSNLSSNCYKKMVHKDTCLRLSRITNKDLCYIILQNYNKSQYITNTYSENIDYSKVLEIQLDMKNKKNAIYVLSTFPLIVMDYNYEKAIVMLKTKLKDDFYKLTKKE